MALEELFFANSLNILANFRTFETNEFYDSIAVKKSDDKIELQPVVLVVTRAVHYESLYRRFPSWPQCFLRAPRSRT